MEDMITMLGEFGLAICLVVAFVGMFWKMWNLQREDGKEREVRDMEQITRLSGILSENSRALLKNSEVMEQISNRLDHVSEDVKQVQQDVNEIKIRQKERDEK